MPPSRGVKKPKEDKSDHRVLANRYRVEKKLGSGNFGTAFLVFDMKANPDKGEEQWKVLKEISCGDLAPDETVDAMHEAKLLSKLQHPNIVKFYDSFLDGEFFCIITEYCEGGDLDDKITAWKKAGKKFDQNVIMDWFVQLSLAVQHMHKRRVLHRDLKTRNIFLKKNMIKIGDFGISRVLMGTTDMASTFTGTPYYMSPEVLKHEGYNSKSDVWSIACILYELCALQHAFEGQSLMGVMYKIVEGKTPEIPNKYDKNIQEILNVMLNRDPAKRPSAAEVTKIAFVTRHIEKMKNRLAEYRDQQEEDAKKLSQDTQELAQMYREKTHYEDLQNESMRQRQQEEEVGEYEGETTYPPPQQGQKDPLQGLTPKEKMLLRKQQKADQEARKLSLHARNNLQENLIRKDILRETLGTQKRPAWQGGRGEPMPPWVRDNPQVYMDPAFRGSMLPQAPNISVYYEDGTPAYAGEEGYWEREEIGTVKEAPARTPSPRYSSSDDRPIKPASSPNPYAGAGKSTLTPSSDNRPITPLKKSINLDDPDIANATPPGVPQISNKKAPAKKQPVKKQPVSKQNSNPKSSKAETTPSSKAATNGKPKSASPKKATTPSSPQKKAAMTRSLPPAEEERRTPTIKKMERMTSMDEMRNQLQMIAAEIPDDVDAAETFYSQHEDFESDSGSEPEDGQDDYSALMDCMQDALDKTTSDQNATITDDTVGFFSPSVRAKKIQNLRTECEKKFGKESFKTAYAFLKEARFGDMKDTMDDTMIMRKLRDYVKNVSDCFLIDQLLFLEEQAKVSSAY
ncbi:serine/threonine-protein kinase Nek11-like [Lytechinus pictus]|uniref:serine/threonine-protein kinase Nek11-like n=1 Tax=Lytechinus pictus TaxID=7653 RepID=UPI0030BA29D1